jgi:hypothetical protein
MTYAIIKNNIPIEYPCYAGDISIKHNVEINSDTWQGGVLDDVEYVKVKDTYLPEGLPDWHYWDYEMPELISGEWVQRWVLKKHDQTFIDKQLELNSKIENLKKYLLDTEFDIPHIEILLRNIKPRRTINIDVQPTTQGLTDL